MKIRLAFLYGKIMNIYGDTGNIITLTQRAKKRGIDIQVDFVEVGDKINSGDYDLYFWGGGQDKEQYLAAQDLSGDKGKALVEAVEYGAALLSICGGYQLLGKYYKPSEGEEIPGVGLFNAYTVAGNQRMIGNIVVETDFFKDLPGSIRTLVGFENHSGKTYLEKDSVPLGRVSHGFGNNGEDRTEGCVYKNAIGCYLHGPALPKNPHLADFLLLKAAQHADSSVTELKPLDNELELATHQYLLKHIKSR